MDDGNYVFRNNDNVLKMKISDYGLEISSVEINGYKKTLLAGYWRRINPNGVDKDYSGPEGWYEFQTNQCNYSFDEPLNGKLTLEVFDCKNKNKNKTITLKRSK